MKMFLRGALVPLLFVVWMCHAPSVWGQSLSFTVAPAYPAGILPTSIAAGDFNGDGKPDLAVTNQNGVSVLLNNGSGGFEPLVNYIVGTNPQSVAAGDFNGDGKMDLAVVNQGSGTVSILLGNGSGAFPGPASYSAGTNPRRVIIADFNGDGKPDLAVVDSGPPSGVSVLLGNGNGTFQSATFVAAGSVSLSVVAGDFNGDNKADLAVANEGSDNVSLLLGNGNGTFQAAVNYGLDLPGLSVSPTAVAAGDFNLDGKLDLAIATPNHQDIAVMLGRGDGTFPAAVHYGLDDPNFVNGINQLAVADMNNDGRPDLVLANLSSNHVTVLIGIGNGSFPGSRSYAAGPEPACVVVADFNGDGIPDVAASDNTHDGTVAVLVGNGDGTLQAAPVRRSGSIPASLTVGDVNGDGKLDIVTASTFGPVHSGLGSGVAMLGNGDGTFQTPKIWSTLAASSVALGDVNGDGKLDLVETIAGPGNGNVSVLLGNGNGTFQTPVAHNVGTTPQTVAVADVNGDGALDLVVGNHNSANVSVLLGAGNGTFQAAVNYNTPVTGTPDSVAVGDLDGDGKLDLIVAISGINATSVSILLGNGDGTFQPGISVASGFHSASTLTVVAADFDGDGRVDFAVTDGASLAVILSNGNAAFQTPFTYLVGAGNAINGTIVAADFNVDGKPDLAVSTRDGISVFLNNGDGSFQPAVVYTPFLGGAIAAGDFDRDGRADLVAADSAQDSTTTDTVALLRNTSVIPVPETIPVTPIGVNPAGGSGNTQTFTFSFEDVNGYADLAVVNVLINNFLDGIGACYVAFAPTSASSGYLYLVDDAGDGGYASGSPIALPSSSNLQNSQCTIHGTGSSVTSSGNTLTLTLAITFAPGFSGNKVFYTAARSNTQNSGWQALGTWTVPGSTPAGPAVGGVSPSRSTSSQTYTFTFTDTAGYADLAVVNVLINNFLDGIGACYVAFAPSSATSGYLYLVDDAGDGGYALGSPMALPSSNTLQNSQCTIRGAGSSVSASGNTLTLHLSIKFSSSFAGNRVFYLAARNNSTGNSGWQAVGSVTVPQLGALKVPNDFTGNGRSGAILYDPSSGQQYTALSNGDGSYSYVPNLLTPGFDTLRTGDFNGDGKADLIVNNSHTALSYVGIGNGDGTFTIQSLFWSPGYDIVQTGDINGDGKTDVALYNSSTGTLYTGTSKGDGTFTYQYHLVNTKFTVVRLSDFTGDGKADLFLYNSANGACFLGIGDGAGGFAFQPLFVSPGYALADTGDLNGDGRADLILYNPTNGNAATGISDGSGGFTFTPLLFSPGFTSIRLADHTGDALADVTMYNQNNGAAYFGTGTGTGTFTFVSLFWSPGYDNVVPEDVNGDGKVDVSLYNSATGTQYTGISNGDGTFSYIYSLWGPGMILAR